jgi:glycosyltransferase involved in cell wall biosynthesis
MGAGRALADSTETSTVADAIREELANFRPDLIHLHHFDAAFATLARELDGARIPIVFTAHDAELFCPISTLILPDGRRCEGGVRVRCLFTGCKVGWGGPYSLWQSDLFRRRLQPKIRAYLAPSRATTEYLRSNGFHPAVHLESFIEVPESIRAAPPPAPVGPFTVGFLGRLETYKGVFDLVEGFQGLLSNRADAILDIAGDGPALEPLRRRCRELGIEQQTRFRGRVEGEAKEAWFRGIHVLAFPSNVYENFGLVALEALVRGRPVVGTNVGGIPEIVEDGRTGRLVPIRRPDALAKALLEVAEHPDRAAGWAALGRARVIERNLPEVHAERLLRVYGAVMDGRRIASGSEAG